MKLNGIKNTETKTKFATTMKCNILPIIFIPVIIMLNITFIVMVYYSYYVMHYKIQKLVST